MKPKFKLAVVQIRTETDIKADLNAHSAEFCIEHRDILAG